MTERGHPWRWDPRPEAVEHANVTRLNRKHEIADSHELHQRSLDPDWFWPAAIEDLDLQFSRKWRSVSDQTQGPQWSKWFVGASLNLAVSCLDKWSRTTPSAPALAWESELLERRHLTYGELGELTGRCANGLKRLGVVPGDRVAIFMPLAPETVAMFYAVAKIGAIVVPIFSGFGSQAVAERLQHASARVVITADGFPRRGTIVPLKETASVAAELAPTVEHLIVWRRMGSEVSWDHGRDMDWDDAFMGEDPQCESTDFPADQPVLLIYTSGSSGPPKGAVHSHSGLLVTIAKDSAYHLDLHNEDSICWITDLGWIMGPWSIVAAGAAGARLCLFEGAPMTPTPDRVWEYVRREKVTVLGIGPTLVRALASDGAEPSRSQTSSLRVIGATGEALDAASYDWLFDQVGGGELPIINFSGGSEVGGCLLAPLVIDPMKRTALGGPALGMDVAIVDSSGEEVGPNEVGDLVCRAPWPGMTQGLWRDERRYLETYWERLEGIWVQGDWASRDSDGQWFLHGRSDDTLNIAGQRIGPAEIEGALLEHPEVIEVAAIGVPHDLKGEAVWCFLMLSPSAMETPGSPSSEELAGIVAGKLGKPFRPDRLVFVEDLPRTRSGKVLRRLVKALATGEELGDLASLENASGLEAIKAGLAASE